MIGHHLLEGKVVSLAKPLGVLHKHVRNTTASDAVCASDDGDPQGEEEDSKRKEVRWDVAAVVQKKMVFAKRPMPIPKAAKPVSTAPGSRTRT